MFFLLIEKKMQDLSGDKIQVCCLIIGFPSKIFLFKMETYIASGKKKKERLKFFQRKKEKKNNPHCATAQPFETGEKLIG